MALKVWAYQWKDKKLGSNATIWLLWRSLPRARQKIVYKVHVPVIYGCYLPCLTFLFTLNIFLESLMSLLTYFLGLSLIKSLMTCLQHMFLMCYGSPLILIKHLLIMIYSFRWHCCLSPADHQSLCPAPGFTQTCNSENLQQDVY